MLKKYLSDKLSECQKTIQSIKDSIVTNAQELKVDLIIKGTERLKEAQKKEKNLISDVVNYLTVSEVIEMSKEPISKFNTDKKVIFDDSKLSWSYQYGCKGITSGERQLLVEVFGYRYKDSKIK